jgi:two-component sensor histidine kinase
VGYANISAPPTTSAEEAAILAWLPCPAFILATSGVIEAASRRAVDLVGRPLENVALPEICAGPEGALRAYLRRCSGSAQPVPGGLALYDRQGRPVRHRAYGGLLGRPQAARPARLFLYCDPLDVDAFSVLGRTIEDRNREILLHQRTQRRLRQALAEKDTLLDELHHRVKNNLQLILGLLSIARRESAGDAAVLDEVTRRVMAIATVQRMLAGSGSLRSVPADELLHQLAGFLSDGRGPPVRVVGAAGLPAISVESAVPMALILTELLRPGGKEGGAHGDVRLRASAKGRTFTIEIEADGVALSTTRPRATSLIDPLLTQLEGELEAGARRAALVFTDPCEETPVPEPGGAAS